jgi:hypothetical protein
VHIERIWREDEAPKTSTDDEFIEEELDVV